ncbi:MAG: IPT/TIG domain-containing protein, partial [Terracidiphilus sp.]
NNPVPVTTSLSRTIAASGGPAFTLNVYGSKFVSTSTVNWNGSPLTTTYVSATELQATVPSADIATAGSAQVTVASPTPGGGTSTPALTIAIELKAAALTSPAPGSILGTTNVTFTWTAGTGATQYNLWLGTSGPGSASLYNSGWSASTSVMVPSLPAKAAKVYARLYSDVNGVTQYIDYTYTEAATLAAMISPIQGSTLGTSNVKFTWTAGFGVTQSNLWVGLSGPGSANLYSSGWSASTSATVPSLPAKGATVYARLYSDVNGVIKYIDYTYTETPLGIPATMITPMQGSTLGTSNVMFTWTAGTGATRYNLYLGLSGPGSSSLFTSGWSPSMSATVPSLPAKGVTVYARLYSDVNGVTQYNDYTYIEK